jgi:hypothetical protein
VHLLRVADRVEGLVGVVLVGEEADADEQIDRIIDTLATVAAA